MKSVTGKQQLDELILRESTQTANHSVGLAIGHISGALLINLILERLKITSYSYHTAELVCIICAMVIYAVPALISFLGGYKKPWNRQLLVSAMVTGGMFGFIAYNQMGRLFVLVPIVIVGAYCSVKISNEVLVGTAVCTTLGIFAVHWMDINITHYYGYAWDISEIVIEHILPMALFIVVLHFATVQLTRGRIRTTQRMIEITATSERRDTELETAAAIQSEVFKHPLDLSEYGDVDVAGDILPAHEVAGDFYDYFFTADHKLILVAGDVLDKGIAAAMFMIGARNSLRSLFSVLDDPETVLRTANKVCSETSSEALVSMFVMRLDLLTGRGEYINAGHTPPVILHADGTAGLIETEPQMILGAFEDSAYTATPLLLEKGDVLFLYTDGISEAVNSKNEPYDMKRLADITRELPKNSSAKDICSAVMRDLDAYSNTQLRSDDRTLLVLRWGNEAPDVVEETWRAYLGPSAQPTVSGAMEMLQRILQQVHADDEMRRTLACAVDDLLTNVMEYSGAGNVQMRVRASEGWCRVTVTDDGKPFDPYCYTVPVTDLLSEGGRGICLVRALMDETAYYYNGKNINTITKYRKA